MEKAARRLSHPFFFYDLDGLKSQLESWSKELPPEITLWYACKANPLSAILKVFRNHGFGIDVASSGELLQAVRSGIRPNHIIATGPAKTREYLRELLDNEIETIVVESLSQLRWLDEVAGEKKQRAKVLLRLQLDWDEGTSVLGGNDITPFGEDAATWKTLKGNLPKNVDILGLHVFQWGNILEASRLSAIWSRIGLECKELASALDIELKVLDLGGGLGIPYDTQTTPLAFSNVKEALSNMARVSGAKDIWMELGRYAIGPFGHYLCRVVDRKSVRGRELLVLEGGINHIARPALTDQAFPATTLKESSAEKIEFHLHGPLCTSLDRLGAHHLPSDIAPGDWLCFHQAGAYGFTESLSFFLCHPLAAEVIVYNNDMMIPRPPKTSSDWLV
jgi:diaminopimelate decarboxylase